MEKSFTLIELMVVIAIIALMGTLGITTYSNTQTSARDTRRKADLKTITSALNAYYSVYNKYPAPDPNNRFTTDPWNPCPYDTNCYTASTFGTKWIPELVEKGFIESLPQDPINNAIWPWDVPDNYSYTYGNVWNNGQVYDLTARLESTTDPDRCEVKNYKFFWDNRSWCQAFGGNYSNQLYESSPGSF